MITSSTRVGEVNSDFIVEFNYLYEIADAQRIDDASQISQLQALPFK